MENIPIEEDRKMKIFITIFTILVFIMGLSHITEAFHAGGVAYCDGCHSMHNSADNPIGGTPGSILIKGSDASSTCLNCHAGSGEYRIASSDGANVNQGGDFFWVRTDFTYPGEAGPETSLGMGRGHNIVATDFGYIADINNTEAPGGTYSSGLLGCTSCHDAHGQVLGGTRGGQPPVSVSGSYGAADPTDGSIHGNFRLLGDSMYTAGDHDADGYSFNNNAPVATSANGATSYGEKTDYGSGMSEWCANCHDYVAQPAKHVAGADALLNGYSVNYNSYIATGDWIAGGGNAASAYDSLVPFERGIDDGSLLDPESTAGPESGDNVMCLTCHRAHASAHPNIGRWDFEVAYLIDSKALISSDLIATAVPYYKNGVEVDISTDYNSYQRSLCNKCHVQD